MWISEGPPVPGDSPANTFYPADFISALPEYRNSSHSKVSTLRVK
jgi:hypothetical protein